MSNVWVAKLVGSGSCTREIGCPFRVLAVRDGSWMRLLEGHADAVSAISATRQGWRDVIGIRPVGYGRYGWTSKGYVQVGGRS